VAAEEFLRLVSHGVNVVRPPYAVVHALAADVAFGGKRVDVLTHGGCRHPQQRLHLLDGGSAVALQMLDYLACGRLFAHGLRAHCVSVSKGRGGWFTVLENMIAVKNNFVK